MALAAAIECFRTEAQDVISVGFRESGFQTVVARASRPCVGCTIRTGGTPVPLPWKRCGRSNFVCRSTYRACEWLNTYRPNGQLHGAAKPAQRTSEVAHAGG